MWHKVVRFFVFMCLGLGLQMLFQIFWPMLVGDAIPRQDAIDAMRWAIRLSWVFSGLLIFRVADA